MSTLSRRSHIGYVWREAGFLFRNVYGLTGAAIVLVPSLAAPIKLRSKRICSDQILWNSRSETLLPTDCGPWDRRTGIERAPAESLDDFLERTAKQVRDSARLR